MANPFDDILNQFGAQPAPSTLPEMEVTPDAAPPAAPAADPFGANPFASAVPAFPASAAPAEVPRDEGFMGITGGAIRRGVAGARQTFSTILYDRALRSIEALDRADAEEAAGRPLKYRWDIHGPDPRIATRAGRAAMRQEALATLGEETSAIAERKKESDITRPPQVAEDLYKATADPDKSLWEKASAAWDVFKKDPLTFIGSVGLQSMVQQLPALATAIPAGAAAGPAGVAGVMGGYSFMQEYASTIMQALAEEGVDLTNPEAIKAATSDPAKMDRIRQRAERKALVVGGIDAASAGLAGKLFPGVSRIPGGPVAQHIVNAPLQGALVQGPMGAAGSALGSLAAGENIDVADLYGEYFGEFFGTPGEIAAARHASRHGRVDTTKHPSPTEQFNRDAASPAKLDDLFPRAAPEAATAPVAPPAPVEGPAAETPPAVTPEAPAPVSEPIAPVAAEPAPRSIDDLGYYSAALEAAREWKQPRGTPNQAIKYLKSKGVKDAEIEATGLEAFLADKKSVTREELAGFLEQNRTRLLESYYQGHEFRTRVVEGFERKQLNVPEDAAGPTKFSNYSLDPTNPTYQERIVHLPENDEYHDKVFNAAAGEVYDAAIAHGATDEQARTILNAIGEASMSPGTRIQLPAEIDTPAMRAAVDKSLQATVKNPDYLSGHFPQPNIVGHYQRSIQMDANGKKVLVPSQIQSDWGQSARDGGVRDEAKIASLTAQIAGIAPQVEALRAKVKADPARYAASDAGVAQWARIKGTIEEESLISEYNRLTSELKTTESAVPGNPLVNTTDQWTNTTLRRALKDAVDSGAESIAIPSGETVLSYNPGDEHGMAEFYNKIVPKNLGNILKRMDPSIKPSRVDTLKSHDGTKDLGKGFTVFPITDKVRDAVRGGQPMYAKTMQQRVTDTVRGGKDHVVAPKVYNNVLNTFRAMRGMMPKGQRMATAVMVEKYDDTTAIVTIKYTDGKLAEVSIPFDRLQSTGAIYGPLDGRNVIVSFRFDVAAGGNQSIRGEVAHEGTHALWESLPLDVRRALIDHGDSLGIMFTGIRDALKNSLYEVAPEASNRGTLFEAYAPHYNRLFGENTERYRDAMEQETAAHMMQWYVTGALTPEQVAPVKHILDGMLNGDYARGAQTERNDATQMTEGPMFSLTGDGRGRAPSLVSVIRSMGGIKDVAGDLKQIVDKGTSGRGSGMPGIINNRQGMTPDRAREHLMQLGFLGPDSTINDLYNLIERSARGERIVSAEHQSDELDFNDQNAYDAERDRAIGDIHDFFTEIGVDYNLSDQEESRVLDLMNEGVSIDDAVERAYMETIHAADESRPAPQTVRTSPAEGSQASQEQPATTNTPVTGGQPVGNGTPRGQASQGQSVTPPPIPLTSDAIDYMRAGNEGGGGRGGPPRDGDVLPPSPPGDRGGPSIESKPKIDSEPNKSLLDKYHALGRRLMAWYNPITGIPGFDQYLLGKYRTLGSIDTAEDVSKLIHKGLKGASNRDVRATYDYLTKRDADPRTIADPKVRETAVYVKLTMDMVGRALVERGLLSEESYQKYRGEYLPRLYLKHLLKDKKLNLGLSGGTRPSKMPYLQSRDVDLDAEVRALLGEIKDPAFLASRGIFRPLRDIAILDFLNEISKDGTWTFQESLVPYNGRRVSPYYLRAEAVALRDRAVLAEQESPQNAAKMRAEADRLDNAAAPYIQNEQKVPEGYERVPDTPRYGMLRGMLVRKEIKRDLLPSMSIVPDDAPYLQQIFKQGGGWQRLNSYFKAFKVPLNPSTQIRNFISNNIMLNLSGVPAYRIPVLMARAAKDMYSNGEYWRFAKAHGLKASGFSEQELGKVAREYLKIERQMALQGKAGYAMYPITIARQIVDAGVAPFSTAYQAVEAMGKMAKMIDAHERQDMPLGQAYLEAQKWLFDYNTIPNWVRHLRNAPLGMPFVTYSYLVLPRIIETAATKPWRMAPYVAIPFVMAEIFKLTNGVDDDDWKKLLKTLPEWLRKNPNATILPYKDAKGRWQAYNYGYLLPWGMFQDAASDLMRGDIGDMRKTLGIFQGPGSQMLAALTTGIDSFSGKPIWENADPPSVKFGKLMTYMARTALPPLLTDQSAVKKMWDSYKDTPTKSGDPAPTMGQSAMRLLGQNIYPIEPEISRQRNISRMKKEIRDIEIKRKYETVRDRSITPAERAERRKTYDTFIKEKKDELRKYMKESALPEKLRTDIRGKKASNPFSDLLPKAPASNPFDDLIPR